MIIPSLSGKVAMKPSSFCGRIALRMPNWLGDAVMASACIESIVKQAPLAKIVLIATDPILELFRSDPRIEGFITISPKSKNTFVKIVRCFFPARYHYKYSIDYTLLLTNSFSSAWQASCSLPSRLVGFKNEGRSFLLHIGVDFPECKTDQHLVKTYKNLIYNFFQLSALAKVSKESFQEDKPVIYLSDKQKKQAQLFRKKFSNEEKSLVIGFNTQSAYGPAKCWLADRFINLADRFLNRGDQCLFFGDKLGLSDVSYIVDSLTSGEGINLAGKTSMQEFVACLSVCDLLITNDSGPMHLASALSIPVVAIFGSTSDTLTGPYLGKGSVLHKKIACSPCFKRDCPFDLECMKAISTDEVWQASLEALKENQIEDSVSV